MVAPSERRAFPSDRQAHYLALAATIALHLTVLLVGMVGAEGGETGNERVPGTGLVVVHLVELDERAIGSGRNSPDESDRYSEAANITTALSTDSMLAVEDGHASVEPEPLARDTAPEVAEQNGDVDGTQLSAAVNTAASGGSVDDLASRYLEAIRATIRRKFADSRRASPSGCRLSVEQVSGGAVSSARSTGAEEGSCALSEDELRDLERAALLAQPLPYAGFEAVFDSSVELAF